MAARNRFWVLYNGRPHIIETKKKDQTSDHTSPLETAIVRFGGLLVRENGKNVPRPHGRLAGHGVRSELLSHACVFQWMRPKGDNSMLDINENNISAVLLNDGWHQPVAGTFKIGDIRIHAEAAAGVDFGRSSATWDERSAAATSAMVTVSAPLTSILAIQQRK
jgi:hypothetical protein